MLEIVKESEQGVIIAPAGSGKTEMGMAVIAELKQQALWLTHTKDLLEQSLTVAKKKLGLKEGEYGVIGGSSFAIGSHITFATVQSLHKRKDLADIGKQMGVVVVDEAHRAAAGIKTMTMFERVLSKMTAKYRIGLTASEHRADGLIKTVFLTIGDKIMEVEKESIDAYLITPEICFVHTDYVFEYTRREGEFFPYSTMLSDMAVNEARNKLIVGYLCRNTAHHNLILGDSLEHLELLRKGLSDYVIRQTEFIHGGTPLNERKAALSRIDSGQSRYLFATYALAKEGLNLPILDRLYLVTPKKDRVSVQQALGRVSRVKSGKDGAIVYDFYDQHVDVCRKHARARIKDVYKILNCKIYGWQSKTKNDLLVNLID